MAVLDRTHSTKTLAVWLAPRGSNARREEDSAENAKSTEENTPEKADLLRFSPRLADNFGFAQRSERPGLGGRSVERVPGQRGRYEATQERAASYAEQQRL